MKSAVEIRSTAVKNNNSNPSKEIDTKIKNIKQEILELDTKYNQAISTQTESFIEMGFKFRRLKLLLQKADRNFEDYSDNNFPHIKERKRQRCMKLSGSVDLEKYPDLKYIPITTLETLATNRRDKSIGELLIEKFGFMDLKQLSDEPTAKAISDFKIEIDDVVSSYNGGWTEIEGNPPNDSNKLKKQVFNKTKRSIEARKSKQLIKQGFTDFEKLQTGVNRCLKILTKHLNQFLNKGAKFYDRKTDDKDDYEPILILNNQDLKDFVSIFRKILKSNKVKANDSECDMSDYKDTLDIAIKKSNLLKEIENDF